jgi:arsenate reductase
VPNENIAESSIMVWLYGIIQCDQVRVARRWLKTHGVSYTFVDLRVTPPSESVLLDWLKHIPFDSLINRRGKTWRELPEDRRRQLVDQGSAVDLMMAFPLVIKRPVLRWEDQLAVGFSDPLYSGLFTAQLTQPSHPAHTDSVSETSP